MFPKIYSIIFQGLKLNDKYVDRYISVVFSIGCHFDREIQSYIGARQIIPNFKSVTRVQNIKLVPFLDMIPNNV